MDLFNYCNVNMSKKSLYMAKQMVDSGLSNSSYVLAF